MLNLFVSFVNAAASLSDPVLAIRAGKTVEVIAADQNHGVCMFRSEVQSHLSDLINRLSERGKGEAEYKKAEIAEISGKNREAFNFYAAAAQKGHEKARISLVKIYVDQNEYPKALRWYQKGTGSIEDPVSRFLLKEIRKNAKKQGGEASTEIPCISRGTSSAEGVYDRLDPTEDRRLPGVPKKNRDGRDKITKHR